MDQEPQNSHKSGLLADLLRSTVAARINGTVTGGDLLVSGGILAVFAASGTAMTSAYLLTGAHWQDCAYYTRDFTRMGAFLATFRVAADAIFYPFYVEVMDRLFEWLQNREPKPREIVRPLPVYAGEPVEPGREYELPNRQVIEWSNLVHFLQVATGEAKGTDKKSWARESWTGGGYVSQGYPDLGNITTRQWAGIRQLCVEWSGRVVWLEDLWRTDDRELTDKFIDLLDAEDR